MLSSPRPKHMINYDKRSITRLLLTTSQWSTFHRCRRMLLSGHVKFVAQMQRCGAAGPSTENSGWGHPSWLLNMGHPGTFETLWPAEVLDKMNKFNGPRDLGPISKPSSWFVVFDQSGQGLATWGCFPFFWETSRRLEVWRCGVIF